MAMVCAIFLFVEMIFQKQYKMPARNTNKVSDFQSPRFILM